MEHTVKKFRNRDNSYSSIYQYDDEYIDRLFNIDTSDNPDTLDQSEVDESIKHISQEEIGKKGNKSDTGRYTDMIDSLFSLDD